MDKLEEAKRKAKALMLAHEATGERHEELHVWEYPWRHKIDVLTSIIDGIVSEMDDNEDVYAARVLLDDAKDNFARIKEELEMLAEGLVDTKAFFPSGMKREVLTDRVTLKSQMPSLPTVVDGIALVEWLVDTDRLRSFVKSIDVKLDNDMAEAIKRWAEAMTGDVGLEAPKPKILSIKVKPKEE